jgi:fumarylacetoacetate (FAA) hydrolase
MGWHFGQWLSLLARQRRLGAGTILGSGPVRMHPSAAQGAPGTPSMQLGDRVRIEMKGSDGADLFGAIEQTVSDPA